MMRKAVFAVLIASGALVNPAIPTIGLDQADAAVRKNVSEYAGRRCNPPRRGSGIVIGRYTGTTDNPILSFGGDTATISRYRCFETLAECRGWLYTMRSKYVDGNSVLIGCERR
ncbi:metallophosphoesterase [Phyllobacterium sp. 0TCS1.6C]|uniref:metallophosphoesterase n=2 Tax=Phyllobacterium TaxID=28100 RepID=UPI002263BA1B|nr:metallophosphoesterase [Phyllobacterium sp. 0TCS1.6C]